MALIRPNVVVYQEYANLTVAPDIPDLNVCIVGPAMQLLDYLDDKDDCYAADYGTYQSDCPLVDPTAVVIAEPPNIAPGGILDPDSVALYFDEAQVVIVESPSPTGASSGVYTLGDNLFLAHTTAGGTHFGESGVVPGDTLIVETPAGAGTPNYVMTVKELCYTLHDYTAALDFTLVTNPVQPDDIITITNDTVPLPAQSRNGTYTVKRVIDAHTLEVVSADWEGRVQTAVPNAADISIVDSTGAPRLSGVAVPLADYCNIRTTSDFLGTAIAADARPWRIERKVSDVLLDSSSYVIDDNQITVAAAITVDLSTLLTGKKVSYAKIYVEYGAFRTDLQVLTTLSNYTEIEEKLGKYDARNPLMVGATVAKANTTTPIKIYGVPDNTLPDYLEFLDRVSSERDVYAIVPLVTGLGSTSIIAAINASCEALADPTYALDNGVKQKFRVVIGSLNLTTTKYLVNATGGCTVSQKSTTAPVANRTLTLIQTDALTPLNLFQVNPPAVGGILPGDIFEVVDTSVIPNVTTRYTVTQVNSSMVPGTTTEFEVSSDAVAITFAATAYFRFVRNGVEVAGSRRTIGVGGVTKVGATASALDDLFLILTCPTASFLTSGCVPGDVLEIPNNPTVNNWSANPRQFVVDEVISNQKLRIKNNGTNTATVETELPHGGRRTDGTEITGFEFCRVLRNLDKTQQVSELVAIAQSFSSKRCLLCYPDEVKVTSLVDGSLPRITDPDSPEAADYQPGYYLACAVGGQTAGQPPHQGFTNVGIAGIDSILNSSEYFTEELLTDLSNGGVYVFVQDNPSALPYSIHEVTTDVSALEFGEYMVVKDFDFVAWTFLDTLLPFIGVWNVTAETIEFIRQALFTTGDNLKARKVAKIGSPLLDYTLDSVDQSTLSRDRIEAYMTVDLPMTLNVIALHLVA